MVNLNMNSPARDRVLKLIEEKDRLEIEIRDQTAILESNHIGMHESLVDDQGFPRNDIDVYKVRHARHQIICLQNDHKRLMKLIEQGLLHPDLLGSSGERSNAPTTSANGHMSNGHSNGHVGNGYVGNSNRSSGDEVLKEPFAVVTSVADGSPADLAGICNNDKILQFGSVTRTNFDDMTQIYNIVTHSVGQPIHVQVKRDELVVSINLVPRPWAQPGLLGCHIQRIS